MTALLVIRFGVCVTLKDRTLSLSGKNDHNALWHSRNGYNT